MSWSAWQRFAPVPPSIPVWSSVDPNVNYCTEIRQAPDACARKIIGHMNPGTNDVKPMSCIARGFTNQLYDGELLQGTYMFQTQNIDSPCNVDTPIYIFRFTP